MRFLIDMNPEPPARAIRGSMKLKLVTGALILLYARKRKQ